MTKRLVLTVGNSMMGDDAAGPLLAKLMAGSPIDGWDVLDGGSVPENCLHQIREMAPEQIVVVDAADMDLEPGAIRLISDENLDDPFLMTTHTLPLSYLIESLRETTSNVELIGIQPDVVSFGYPISLDVKNAVEEVYENLKQAEPVWKILENLDSGS
ncbi:MAG: hydrogenase maturation peptidase HycI [Anaerolineales bacterium]|nr:hydrogenase maturation peptidase HycI [Anaerolineales bacterium]